MNRERCLAQIVVDYEVDHAERVQDKEQGCGCDICIAARCVLAGMPVEGRPEGERCPSTWLGSRSVRCVRRAGHIGAHRSVRIEWPEDTRQPTTAGGETNG